MSKLFSNASDAFQKVVDALLSERGKAAGYLLRVRSQLEGPAVFINVVLGAVVFSFLWASLAQIDRVVRVEGKIIPAGRSQEIQHLEGGIIASISTREGSSVKRGDLLLTIDDTTAGANLGETQSKLLAKRVRAQRLEAETKEAKTIEFSPDLAGLPVASGEKGLFLSRKSKLDQELAVHEDTMRQRKSELDEGNKRRARLADELKIAKKRSDIYTEMAVSNAASKLEILEAESKERRLETEISNVENSIPTLQAAIASEQSRIEATRAGFRTEAQNELVSVAADIEQLTHVLTAETDRVNRTEIRAPIDGIINRISVNTVGGVVKPGESLIELIPFTSTVLIEAKARPKDRGYLMPGLDAVTRVSAYDVGELGVLKGHVTEVSADTVQDARGDPYYRVNILVSSIPSSYADRQMVPGMTVTADVVTGRRTVLSHLLSPLSKFTYNMFKDSR